MGWFLVVFGFHFVCESDLTAIAMTTLTITTKTITTTTITTTTPTITTTTSTSTRRFVSFFVFGGFPRSLMGSLCVAQRPARHLILNTVL